MGRDCRGIRHIKGNVYLLDFQAGKVRKQCRIRAESLKEAKAIRQERLVDLRKQLPYTQTEKERLNASINEAWQKLESDILSDGLCHKNILRYSRTFRRVF